MENNRKNKLICILFALFFAFGFFLCVLLPKDGSFNPFLYFRF